MFYLELCSHFLFCIFKLAVYFLWLHLINNVTLASFDNVSLASLDNVSMATIGFFTLCQQSSSTFFKTGACFFGCDWFIDLASTRVFTIWNQLSNRRFYLRIGPLALLQRPQPWQEFNANRPRFFKNLRLPAANQPFSKLHHLSSSQLRTYLHLLLCTKSVSISIPFFICYLHTEFHFTFCLHHFFHSWYIYLQILSSLPFTI